MIALALIAVCVIALAVHAMRADQAAAWAKRAEAAMRADLHAANAANARLRAQRDEAYDCNEHLFDALIESRRREAAAKLNALIVPAPLPVLGYLGDETVADRNHRGVL
ncbi:hypothetical protein GCM10017784_35460 [Deinococcus indicus]|uniref:hypothetical protein n=1 Tax=Deinococcus indicus TaxID=223556 RepID=UPI0017496873|nr:hypothetical protein [Deinococcus indicus]GHG37862.1 hypothetical protein GCM10017784_35460 [Deinococcus indicus]